MWCILNSLTNNGLPFGSPFFFKFSFDTISNIFKYQNVGNNSATLGYSNDFFALYFMPLFLSSVNTKTFRPKYIVFYLWSATVWLTSVKGFYVISIRNLFSWCVHFSSNYLFWCRYQMKCNIWIWIEYVWESVRHNYVVCRTWLLWNRGNIVEVLRSAIQKQIPSETIQGKSVHCRLGTFPARKCRFKSIHLQKN